MQQKMNVGFISLGCSKNLVDTEMMIGLFKSKQFNIVNDPKEADIIIVNTCGFIEQAKEEAINTLLEMAEYKKGRCKYLIATGCLVERYKDELEKEMPEVDGFIKFSQYDSIWNQIEQIINQKENMRNHGCFSSEKVNSNGCVVESEQRTKNKLSLENFNSEINEKNKEQNNDFEIEGETEKAEKKDKTKIDKAANDNRSKLSFAKRVLTTGDNYAYIRIADGCDNFCTFCAIPYIRGRFKSRPQEDILNEIEIIAKQGIREFIIIAQDTTKYGVDIYGKPKLAELLHKISQVKGVEWIRFLYSYPETITEELIEEVKNNDKICKYFDIPMQHISDAVLKKMNRKSSEESTKKLIKKLRAEIPGVIIRSTLMVGFPGETEEDFIKLYDFVKWAKFDKLGCFMYSKEEGTAAEKMPNQIKKSIKENRYNKIMELQKEISKEKLKEHIGSTYKILIEDAIVRDDNKAYFIGRTYMDVPEIDGYVYIEINDKNRKNVEINTFAECKIIKADDYDLYGGIIN